MADPKTTAVLAEMERHFQAASAWAASQRAAPAPAPFSSFMSPAAVLQAYRPLRALLDDLVAQLGSAAGGAGSIAADAEADGRSLASSLAVG